jgi:formate hydrogenlyase subunit 6/NADH:ubiquinone oxidoreductase subunit I
VHQFGENNPKKSAIVIKSHLLEDGHYRIGVCDQCGICEQLCPTNAIAEVEGVYQIDSSACVWCLICVRQCPQEAMVVGDGEMAPIKCTVCGECVELCPTGALALVQ